MSPALSIDLRERVLGTVAAGVLWHQVAKRFEMSLAGASRWRGLFAHQGHVASKPSKWRSAPASG